MELFLTFFFQLYPNFLLCLNSLYIHFLPCHFVGFCKALCNFTLEKICTKAVIIIINIVTGLMTGCCDVFEAGNERAQQENFGEAREGTA